MSFIIIHELKDEWKYLWFSIRMSLSKELANYILYTKCVLPNQVFHTASVKDSKKIIVSLLTAMLVSK